MTPLPMQTRTKGRCRGLQALRRKAVLPGGTWYRVAEGDRYGAAVSLRPPDADMTRVRFLSFDMLLAGDRFVTFFVQIEGGGRESRQQFSPLCECQTRIVLPWPGFRHATGITVGIERKTEPPAEFCLGPICFPTEEPPMLSDPVLPRGPLVDTMGQSTLHRWPGKTPDVATMVKRLARQRKAAQRRRRSPRCSRWGGWRARRVRATGFFRTHHDGRRWWLVDPDGCLFWSSGLDCVHSSIDGDSKIETRYMNLTRAHANLPSVQGPFGRCYRVNPWHAKDNREFNYREANFIRAFGPESWYNAWITVAHAELRRLGFNTAGDWSDEYAARREGTPYTRPLELYFRFPHTPSAGPLPDVFHPGLKADARAMAEDCLRETRDDPCMLGYFLHNEPAWDHDGGVAQTMLRQSVSCLTRHALADRLHRRYGGVSGLRRAWGMDVTLRQVADGPWSHPFTAAATEDLRQFSTVMLSRLLRTVSKACKRVDPNHLNLGVRWWTFPPVWALKAMGCFDVVSFNYYLPKVDMVGYGREREPDAEAVAFGLKRPFMVGEWHVGALDGGLPSAGLSRVKDQAERGKAFRVYLENAAALPWCVGAHWFNMYDRNALYWTGSNENCNIGFLDNAHRRQEAIGRAAQKTHARLYEVTAGEIKPFDREVDYRFPSR